MGILLWRIGLGEGRQLKSQTFEYRHQKVECTRCVDVQSKHKLRVIDAIGRLWNSHRAMG